MLLLALGNIGADFEKTRHNAGFRLADFLAARWQLPPFAEKKKFAALLAEGEFAGKKILLAKPTTMMNLSGRAARALTDFYDIPLEEMLVLVDDFALPLGEIRFRKTGSHGGQNGLRDIICQLGMPVFPRLRIGIRPAEVEEIADPGAFVLQKFGAAEEKIFSEEVLPAAAEKVEEWLETAC